MLGDYCDGELFRTHNLFSIHCNALQIIAYFDEVEVCNPLGSHSGLQKLGTVKLLMLWLLYLAFLLQCQISDYLIWHSQQSLSTTFCTHVTA